MNGWLNLGIVLGMGAVSILMALIIIRQSRKLQKHRMAYDVAPESLKEVFDVIDRVKKCSLSERTLVLRELFGPCLLTIKLEENGIGFVSLRPLDQVNGSQEPIDYAF